MSEKDTTTAVAPRFYTLQELADLGVGSESTLRKAIKEGRLSFHRFGTAYRIAKTISTPTSRPHAALPRSYSTASSMPS